MARVIDLLGFSGHPNVNHMVVFTPHGAEEDDDASTESQYTEETVNEATNTHDLDDDDSQYTFVSTDSQYTFLSMNDDDSSFTYETVHEEDDGEITESNVSPIAMRQNGLYVEQMMATSNPLGRIILSADSEDSKSEHSEEGTEAAVNGLAGIVFLGDEPNGDSKGSNLKKGHGKLCDAQPPHAASSLSFHRLVDEVVQALSRRLAKTSLSHEIKLSELVEQLCGGSEENGLTCIT
jgi:hypothetical protein